MANVKTAVTLKDSLLKQAEETARALKISRSQLLARALEDFLHRYESQQLLERINQTTPAELEAEEKAWLYGAKHLYQRTLEDEW